MGTCGGGTGGHGPWGRLFASFPPVSFLTGLKFANVQLTEFTGTARGRLCRWEAGQPLRASPRWPLSRALSLRLRLSSTGGPLVRGLWGLGVLAAFQARASRRACQGLSLAAEGTHPHSSPVVRLCPLEPLPPSALVSSSAGTCSRVSWSPCLRLSRTDSQLRPCWVLRWPDSN